MSPLLGGGDDECVDPIMTACLPITVPRAVCLTVAITSHAAAGFVDYDDAESWLAAAGAPTTIDFVLPPGGIITDQYASLGVSFPPGNDLAYSLASLFSDGWGAQGSPHTFGDMIVQWDQSLMAIACVTGASKPATRGRFKTGHGACG